MNNHTRVNKNTYQTESSNQKVINIQMNSSKNRINNTNPQLIKSPSIKKYPSHIRQARNEMNGHNKSITHSNTSHRFHNNSYMISQKVIQLQQKLKNIHIFYKTKIQQQKAKTHQRNQIFINISQQQLKSHNDKMIQLKTLYEQAQVQKKDIGLVDQRMNDIKSSIDQILKQSSDLKESNQKYTKKIEEKQHIIRQKQEELNKLKSQVLQFRNELQAFQRINLKQNKKNKDILGMIQKFGSLKVI